MTRGGEQVQWLSRVDADLGNMRATLTWALGPDGDPTAALRVSAALAWFWRIRSHLIEGRRWLDAALAATADGAGTDRRAELLWRARALNGVGLLTYAQHDLVTSREYLVDARTAGRSLADAGVVGWAVHGLGRIALEDVDPRAATALFEESISLFDEVGDERGRAYSMFFLGAVFSRCGEHERAEDLFSQGEAPLRAAGDLWGLAALLTFSAAPALARADVGAAARRYGEALVLYARLGTVWMASQALLGLAHTAALSAQPTLVVRLYGSAAALAELTGGVAASSGTIPRQAFVMLGLDDSAMEADLVAAHQRLDVDAYESAWNEGHGVGFDAAVRDGIDAAREIAAHAGTEVDDLPARAGLSDREWDVLRLVADGHSNKEIARRLVVSARTVENHLAHIYTKLGVHNRVSAALYALGAEPRDRADK